VDGCYGGVAACVPDAPADLKALAHADSLAIDPHKWLYAPLEAGALLVREPGMLRDAFSFNPTYYHFGQEVTNYFDFGLQNSRGFRALKVWLALRQVGREGYAKMIGDDIRLSQWLAQQVEAHDELQLFSQRLSIATFRYVPPELRGQSGAEVDARLNKLNQDLLDRLQRSGEAFLSNAVVGGRYLLRPCIVNFHTNQADLTALLESVVKLGRQVDQALRAGA
jgi:glutamate/tyrosine decarboxylase-like PLP-dependent enzyme